MRWLALLVVPLLAGCFQPPEEEDRDPLLGWCPQWQEGASEPWSAQVDGAWNQSLVPVMELDGHPFDLVRIHVASSNGTLRLTAHDVELDRSLILRDHRRPVGDQVQSRVDLGGSDFLVEALINVIDADAPRSGPVDLRLAGQGSVEGTLTYLYRVCGA